MVGNRYFRILVFYRTLGTGYGTIVFKCWLAVMNYGRAEGKYGLAERKYGRIVKGYGLIDGRYGMAVTMEV